MSRLRSWRLALRLARRDALRHRGRSVLVLVMVALPVLAVTAADVLLQTQDVSGVESLPRRLGAADALVDVDNGGRPVVQRFDPYDGSGTSTSGDGPFAPPTAASVSAALGGARLVEERTGEVGLRTDDGVRSIETTEVDLRDPVTRGLFDLTWGRWPQDRGEVVVNRAVLDEGYAVGDRLRLADDGAPAPTIVGVAESTTTRTYPEAAGPLGSLGVGAGRGPDVVERWLVDGGPVDWSTVRRLNAMGATVLSRAVVTDPPPASELPEELGWGTGNDAGLAVLALIVVMALLEVVLLAGPAFAVTARRQSRTLALMAASGGTPKQSRRVVLGGGVVLGTTAATAGVLLGIGTAWLLVPVVQHWSDTWLGPFDVPWRHLVGIALFGLASAVLAAVVPAWIASRQDVVAVLAGRRADTRPSVRSPLLGLVLLGAGVAGSAYGATETSNGEFAIAASSVVAVLGMILLVPVVVVGVARLAGRLPLSPRYAARDAARHRTRTVPAVAAVAATVAGVVALGIGLTSDEKENRETYTPTLPMGQGSVTADIVDDQAWTALAAKVQAKLPGATVTPIVGVVESTPMDAPDARAYSVSLTPPGGDPLMSEWGSSYATSVLIGDRVPAAFTGLSAAERARADAALAAGRVVAFADHPIKAHEIDVESTWMDDQDSHPLAKATVPAVYVRYDVPSRPGLGVLPPAVARRLKVPPHTVALAVSGVAITRAQEEAVSEVVQGTARFGSFIVERGYQADDATAIVQAVLVAMGAVLMLGGTLTATFLALSDARPDLATLSAVGASPRRRRSVAASYALVIGFVGAILGAVVGFIPGIAVIYPLTAPAYTHTGPFLDIPWTMILGVVIGLPLVTALIVAACTRSRLPMVSRLD